MDHVKTTRNQKLLMMAHSIAVLINHTESKLTLLVTPLATQPSALMMKVGTGVETVAQRRNLIACVVTIQLTTRTPSITAA